MKVKKDYYKNESLYSPTCQLSVNLEYRLEENAEF